MPGGEVWRNRRGLFVVDRPHSFFEHFIRCDILSAAEQIGLAQQRIQLCSEVSDDYHEQQSKTQPNFSRWKEFEKAIKSFEKEIAQEQQYIELLHSTPGQISTTSPAIGQVPIGGSEEESSSTDEQVSPRTNNAITPTDRQASSEVGTGDIGTTNIATAENRAEIETNVT